MRSRVSDQEVTLKTSTSFFASRNISPPAVDSIGNLLDNPDTSIEDHQQENPFCVFVMLYI